MQANRELLQRNLRDLQLLELFAMRRLQASLQLLKLSALRLLELLQFCGDARGTLAGCLIRPWATTAYSGPAIVKESRLHHRIIDQPRPANKNIIIFNLLQHQMRHQ